MSDLRIAVDQDFRSGLGHVTPVGLLDAQTAILLRDGILKCAAEHPRAVLVDLDRMTLARAPHLTVLLALGRRLGGNGVGLAVHVRPNSATGDAARRALGARLPVYPDRAAAEAAVRDGPVPPARRHVHLQPDPGAPAAARALVRQACAAWGTQSVCPDAEVIVSELVSNAVRHAHTDLDVTVVCRHRHLIVQVRDHSPTLPRVPDQVVVQGLSGRGFRLIVDLASGWGASTGSHGKTVWASLRLDPGSAPTA